MLTQREILQLLAENKGQYAFTPEKLGLSFEAFQPVVAEILRAEMDGLLADVMQEPSGMRVGMELVLVRELTDRGRKFLGLG